MTNKEYRKAEGVSRSDLWLMSKSPLHYKYHIENPVKQTPALAFGSAMHKMVEAKGVEKDFLEEFAVKPASINKKTVKGKEQYDLFQERAGNRTVIDEEDYIKIWDMWEALKQNRDAYLLLSGGRHEESFFWTDLDTGIKCKVRPDVITEYEGKPVLVDYKTTDSVADGHFEASCKRYGYKFQAGMYTEGLLQSTFQDYGFIFVAQEKTPPYASRIYVCKPDWIRQGHDQFRIYIGMLKYCLDTGDWYGPGGHEHQPTLLIGD